jgi:chorismate mutase
MRERFSNVGRGSKRRGSAGASSAGAGATTEITAPFAASSPEPAGPAPVEGPEAKAADTPVVDLKRRRAQLSARVAELQFDLGGLVYEMAIRDRIRVDVIVKRAALLQDADAELSEVERILKLEETSTAGSCANCGAPHSSGAAYCWQCGQPLLQQVPEHAIG